MKNDGDAGTRAIRRALLQNFDIGLEDLEMVRRCIACGETEHGARFLPRFPLTRLSLSHCDGDVTVAITGGRSRRPTYWVRRWASGGRRWKSYSGKPIITTVLVNQATSWTATLQLGSWRGRNPAVTVVIAVVLKRVADDTYETG